jgi:hypothetical protein
LALSFVSHLPSRQTIPFIIGHSCVGDFLKIIIFCFLLEVEELFPFAVSPATQAFPLCSWGDVVVEWG